MLKIYFCASIRGGRELASSYEVIIRMLQEHGLVLTEHLGDDEEIENMDRILSDQAIHDRDMQWIREADLLVAEVSVTSLGVGYEIGRAIEMEKPVLCLYKKDSEKPLSAMITGSKGIHMYYYSNPGELSGVFVEFMAQHAAHRTS